MRRMIPLSSLSAGRRNPRRVRCEREAHRRLVASIRWVGLLQPLLVRPVIGDSGSTEKVYTVVAGRRRLEALRAIYRSSGENPGVKCEVEVVDDSTADTMALAENFAREGMHPLDEAEAFAKLADCENKGVAAVASEFGVSSRYVRQRMKLAGLADTIKAAYRSGEIDTGTAEVFASVPANRQIEAWEEAGGCIHNARHAHNLIECRWIDARLAHFDPESLPDAAVSRDLFGDRLLIERSAFMPAQAEAIEAEAHELREEGWGEVMFAKRDEVFDRLRSMATPGPDYDETTHAKLLEIGKQRQALESSLDELAEDDESAIDALYARLEDLDEKEAAVTAQADPIYSEAIKAVGTVFLILDPDGHIHREFRVPRSNGDSNTQGQGHAVNGQSQDTPPTCEDLSERQQQAAFVHETLALRSVLLGKEKQAAHTRRVLLAMMLSEGVGSLGAGLLIRREPDPIARYIENQARADTPCRSEVWEQLSAQQAEADPLHGKRRVSGDTVSAYKKLANLTDEQLDQLIDLLIVQSVSGSLAYHTDLIAALVVELGVELRAFWTPDKTWFAGYRKIQLMDLLDKLWGKAHGNTTERLKKSELVENVTRLFAQARDGQLNNEALAAKVNAWLPSCIRPRKSRPRTSRISRSPGKNAEQAKVKSAA